MLEHLLNGGPLMIPIMGCSVLALAVILDRLYAFRAAKTDNVALRAKVEDLLYEGKLDESITVCEKSKGPVAAVLLVGLNKYRKLLRLKRPVSEIEVAISTTMEDYAPRVMNDLEKRMNILSLVGGMAPLLGMTGTVTGMIRSFNAMSEAAGLDAGTVASGISEALITTAAGLLVAMPAVAAYNFFTKKVDSIVLEIDESITLITDFISLGRR